MHIAASRLHLGWVEFAGHAVKLHLQQGCKPLCLQTTIGDGVEGDNLTAYKR